MKLINAKRLFSIFFVLLLIPFIPIVVVDKAIELVDKIIPSESQSLVAFTVDDGYAPWVEIIDPLFEKHDLSITGFINDVENGKRVRDFVSLTWDDVEWLSETGRWEFGWHGLNHLVLTRLTSDEKEEEISGFGDLFEEHSLPRPETYCYAFGAYDLSTMVAVSKHFSVARTVSEGVNTVYWVKEYPMQIRVIHIYWERDNDYYKNIVSENLDKGVFIVFYLHSVEDPIKDVKHPIEISSEDFEEFIEWLVEQNVEVVTFSQGIEEMKTRRSVGDWIIKRRDRS